MPKILISSHEDVHYYYFRDTPHARRENVPTAKNSAISNISFSQREMKEITIIIIIIIKVNCSEREMNGKCVSLAKVAAQGVVFLLRVSNFELESFFLLFV